MHIHIDYYDYKPRWIKHPEFEVYIELQIEFYLRQLLTRSELNKLHFIELSIKSWKDISGDKIEGGGAVHVEDDEAFIDLYVSDTRNNKEMELTLAHECVHIKQELRGELKQEIDGVIWEDIYYTWQQMDKLLADAPWEIEAYEKEADLAESYRNL